MKMKVNDEISPLPAQVEGLAMQLLPCPFCGSTPIVTTEGKANQFVRVVCGGKEWCVMVRGTGYFVDKAVLVEAWNTRADSDSKAKIEAASGRLAALAQAIQSFVNADSPSLREADALGKLADDALGFVEALSIDSPDTKKEKK